MSKLSLFLTDLGWFGLLGSGNNVSGLTIGHSSADDVRRSLRRRQQNKAESVVEADWFPTLRQQLEQYASGERVDFSDVRLNLPPLTEFQSRVVQATRRIPYGKTLTYGDLAERAAAPRAARAVGSVMAANRFPIIVPCHRVVASNGKLGGFSAPQGVSLKQQMLALEAESSILTSASSRWA